LPTSTPQNTAYVGAAGLSDSDIEISSSVTAGDQDSCAGSHETSRPSSRGQVSISGHGRPPITVTTPPRSSVTGEISHAANGGLQPLLQGYQEGNGG